MGIMTPVIANETVCVKMRRGEGVEAVIEVTAEPVVGPCRGKTIVVLATPLSTQDVYIVFTCLRGNQVPNVRYHL